MSAGVRSVQASNVAGIAVGAGTVEVVELQAQTRSRQRRPAARRMRAVISLWWQKRNDVSPAIRDGTFRLPVAYETNVLFPIAAGDFDGDGIIDIVCAGQQLRMTISLVRGDGTFA